MCLQKVFVSLYGYAYPSFRPPIKKEVRLWFRNPRSKKKGSKLGAKVGTHGNGIRVLFKAERMVSLKKIMWGKKRRA